MANMLTKRLYGPKTESFFRSLLLIRRNRNSATCKTCRHPKKPEGPLKKQSQVLPVLKAQQVLTVQMALTDSTGAQGPQWKNKSLTGCSTPAATIAVGLLRQELWLFSHGDKQTSTAAVFDIATPCGFRCFCLRAANSTGAIQHH